MTRPRRLLVVDDEPDIRELARISLERVGGHQVTTAASGDEALAAATAADLDAVLLDVMMPGGDGPATLARLRAARAGAETPVIFLTAKAQPGERARLMSLGAAGVIGKPFDPMALAAQVAEVLGWER